MDNDLALLHEKIDGLSAQLEAQQKRQAEFDELKRDMMPIANHFIKLSIDELAEIGSDFELEDLLFLLKRALRDARRWILLLDRIEAGMDLADEVSVIGKQAFSNTVEMLDKMERQGFFAFARGGWYILERIVEEFDEEDVRALGDNIVTILTTVRNMTQPEVLALANNAVSTLSTEDALDGKVPSTFSLLRELSDPQVRKGLSRMLNLVKSLADQPPGHSPN
jgi:uncharacterized protein YjgD (DUF1641 family)